MYVSTPAVTATPRKARAASPTPTIYSKIGVHGKVVTHSGSGHKQYMMCLRCSVPWAQLILKAPKKGYRPIFCDTTSFGDSQVGVCSTLE